MAAAGRSHWTAAADAELRARWQRGDTCAVIGRALGITKSAVIGRAHRIGMAKRAAPIALRKVYKRAEDTASLIAAVQQRLSVPAPGQPADGRSEREPWTAQQDLLLVEMWNAGSTRAQIGAAVGRSLNAVKSRREVLNLAPRERLVVQPDPIAVPLVADAPHATPAVAVRAPVVRRAPHAGIVRPSSMPLRRDQPCQWPTTEGRRHFFRCCEPRHGGRVYCEAHAAQAYRCVEKAA